MFDKIKKVISNYVKKNFKKKGISNTGFTAPDVKTYNQLTNFVFNFPVNTIKYNGEHVWPYIRHHLLVQLTAVSIGNKNAVHINPFRLQLGNPDDFDLDRKKELAEKYGFNFLEDLKNEPPTDFIFFTALNASEQIEIDSKIYYRVTDPIFELASQIGSARKVELIRNNSPAIEKTTRYLHRPTFIYSPHIIRSGYVQNVYIKDSIRNYFRRYLPALEYDRAKLNKLIDWELHTRDFYLDMLRALKPKVIFVPSFHYYAPLISAARELGIFSVDVQHGIQVGYNPLYNNWSEMPREGYKCLPDYFFVWGEKERQNITTVFGPHSSPRVIGNLWLKKQLDMDIEFSPELERALASRKRFVLLAMQSQTAIPQLFKDLVGGSGEDFLWIIRMHPKGKKYRPSDFSIDTRNILISDEVDKLPIVPLLNRVDITISEGSTIAVEGDTLGVAAFITSETGKLNYKTEIEEGTFYYIENLEGFLKAVDSLGQGQGAQREPSVDHDVLAILAEISGVNRSLADK